MLNTKIGIIGAGMIGSNIGINLAKAGYPVMISSRHPEELKPILQDAGSNAQIGTVKEAAAFGNVIVLAIPFGAVSQVKDLIADVKGKIIWDITNPYPGRDGRVAQLAIDNPEFVASEFNAAHFPDAHLVKALNTIHFKDIRDKAFPSGGYRMAVPLAGNDIDSKQVIADLLFAMGFEPVDLGDLKQSRVMEPNKILYNKALKRDELMSLMENRQ